MADAKQQIMDQVRQQAALANARALVEVSPHLTFLTPTLYTTSEQLLTLLIEIKRTLFRTLRPQTRHLFIFWRIFMLYNVYGEIHDIVECCE